MSAQEAAATFDKQPSLKLCFDYYYASGLNIYINLTKKHQLKEVD
jgi:hypothetical protein